MTTSRSFWLLQTLIIRPTVNWIVAFKEDYPPWLLSTDSPMRQYQSSTALKVLLNRQETAFGTFVAPATSRSHSAADR